MKAPGARPQASTAVVRLAVAATGAGAAAVLGFAWLAYDPPDSWTAVAVLAVLAMLSWVLREKDVGAKVFFSFTSIVLLAAAAIVTPFGAGVVGLAATLPQRGQSLLHRIFNASMSTIIGAVGGITYRLAHGEFPVLEAQGGAAGLLLLVGLPLLLADVVQCLVNALLLAGIMQVSGEAAFRPALVRMLTTTGPAYVTYGVFGFLLVLLWLPAGVGWFSAVLILAPLLVAQWAYAQYGDEERAHQRTLRALVTAVETKDPRSAGHSDRVARLSAWTAEALGLGPREIGDARSAGMLHDLGLLAVPTRVLRRARPEDAAEVAEITTHPLAGVRMLEGIQFLRGALPAIRSHHERLDGLGYPDGLAGGAIPVAARVLAAADAFDALTSGRTARVALGPDAALEVLRGRTGTHLDPAVVEALARAVQRHGWDPPAAAGAARTRGGWDHDDPDTSDLLAGRRPVVAQSEEPAC